jgi:hypothetical protein
VLPVAAVHLRQKGADVRPDFDGSQFNSDRLKMDLILLLSIFAAGNQNKPHERRMAGLAQSPSPKRRLKRAARETQVSGIFKGIESGERPEPPAARRTGSR